MKNIDHIYQKNLEIDNYIKNYIVEQIEYYYYSMKTYIIYN